MCRWTLLQFFYFSLQGQNSFMKPKAAGRWYVYIPALSHWTAHNFWKVPHRAGKRGLREKEGSLSWSQLCREYTCLCPRANIGRKIIKTKECPPESHRFASNEPSSCAADGKQLWERAKNDTFGKARCRRGSRGNKKTGDGERKKDGELELFKSSNSSLYVQQLISG